MALLNLGKPEEAVRHFKVARSLRPDDVGLAAQVDLLERALEDATPPTRRMASPAVHMPPEPRKSVLVVDDSTTMRKLVGMTMERHGFRVIEAQDGMEALATIDEQGNPNLVVLDVTMPRMDGYSFCRTLRQNPLTAEIPVIMLSARDGFLDRMRGRMAGTDAYLTKPFQPGDLVRVVREFCPFERADVLVETR
jgi:twitching motility two-component system response regulator PilG